VTWREALGEFERQFIEAALKEHGSVSAAARAIGKNRTDLHSRMRLYGLHSPVNSTFARRGL
jgi:transcriptional regulator with GAF, ATPase, and Fis domain